jgi:hypothetical protein
MERPDQECNHATDNDPRFPLDYVGSSILIAH